MSLAEAPREKFADLFTPKLITVWREGYTLAQFRADVFAGLTVAIVALPLSTAIAIASGATPQAGLFASAIGGFFVSALGGSRFQIGGPAGAFIVLVASTIEKFGYSGFVAATLMAGAFLLAIGYLRLGTYIKYIPHSVAVGFTAAIGLIIFTSQLHELFGLRLDHEPAAFLPKVESLWAARETLNPQALALAVACLGLIVSLRAFAPRFPGLLAAVAFALAATWALDLHIATIGSRFGELPRGLPAPALPHLALADWWRLAPAALAIAVLGGIESLLSAVVADGMTGRRHRSNCELAAQGWANIASALFGGLCVTGAIARTATNIRAGAHGPVAGILHAIMLMAFLMLAAPLAAHIPLAALAAILTLVSWNMIERDQIAAILRSDRGEAVILLVTAGLTVFEDVTIGIAAGVTLGALIFMHKMAQVVAVETGETLFEEDSADASEGEAASADPDFLVYRIAGPFFFGAVNSVAAALDHIGRRPKIFVLDLSKVPLADGAAAHALHGFITREQKHGVRVILSGASRGVHRTLVAHGVNSRLVHFSADVADARAYCDNHEIDKAIAET
ncbi:sodium-independent anion transporter [Rhodoblastus sphagnicola]|uniref:Sodium-independent anion transporter n=1 Tax=Rhodoblastus sphagnicola TaxID=333368 RepID=A0A2S6NA48_9HYPH|nr:SulP family inorganic anion transporter [Rhodoblastus sphagnicola]MBB4198878.1 SulP family sulfate permease [Rhodoblastus sphagnicola]PPQ31495.1 sodium-independent anion transporter [Rhodoblastus sphagnicola]